MERKTPKGQARIAEGDPRRGQVCFSNPLVQGSLERNTAFLRSAPLGLLVLSPHWWLPGGLMPPLLSCTVLPPQGFAPISKKRLTFLPGDRLATTCEFDSTSRTVS